MTIDQLILRRRQHNEMLRYVIEHAPLEACGLLAGKKGRVEKVILIRNQAQSPTRFVMDPYEQLQAFEWIDSHGLELIGIFHSHPAGSAAVSTTDIREAAYEVVHVIWSCLDGNWESHGFWIEAGQAQEIPILVEDR